MRLLMLVALLGMMLAHIDLVGMARYLLVVPALVFFFVIGKKVYVTGELWYNIGGALVLAGMIPGSLLHGDTLSYAYVLFGFMMFFFLPVLKNGIVDDGTLGLFLLILGLTIIPLGYRGDRLYSVYVNTNNYCGVVLCSLYFAFLFFRDQPRWQIVTGLVGLLLIILGGSRSIFGAWFIFTGLYWVQRYVLKTVLRRSLVLGFLLMCFGYYSLVTDDRFKLVETIQQNKLSEKNERGLSHRDELFYISMDVAEDYPEGVGLGMSNYYIEDEIGLALSPHNAYLKILLEGGAVMLVGFLIIMLGFLWTNTTSPLASSIIFALLFRSLFESATPFTVSLISSMFILPMFLNERTVAPRTIRFLKTLAPR